MAVFELLRRICEKITLLGALYQTTLKDHLEAVRELLISVPISTAPLWGGTIILFIVQSAAQDNSFLKCFRIIIQNGELFIYSAATLAPVIYIVTRDRDDVRSFPSKHTFIALVIICSFLSAIIFTIGRITTKVLPAIIIDLSIGVYILAILVFYLALVYNNTFLPNPPKKMRDEEDDYYKRLLKHRT